ncbi:MAG: hypothetical protein JW795_21025, partial [Chitinivibrionales bacterium]|nr:hypothetical protein [Chitinivibrionales bacterium]
MKHSIRQQLSFVEPIIPHEHAQELKMVSKILNNCPTIAELVCADLFCELADPKSGRDGVMSAEQVYKALTVKQMNSFSY